MPNATVCEKYEAEEVPFLYGNPTEAYRYFCLGFGIFVCLYLIVGFGLFCYYQPKLVRLQNRSMYMNFCLMAAFLLLNVTIYLREFIGREHFPCQVLLWSFYLSIYFAAGAIVGSQYLYLYKLRSQREQGNLVALIWKNRGREQRVQSDHTNQSTSARSIDKTKNFFAFLYDFVFVLKHSKDGKIGTMLVQVDERDDASSINGSDSVMSNPLFLFSSDSPNKDYSISMREKLIQTFALPTVLMMTFGAPLIIAAAVRSAMEPPFYNLCNGCKLSWIDYLILTLCGIENMVMMAIGLYAMRREADPIGIFYEVKVASMAGVVVILGWLLQSLDAGGVYRDYKFTWDILYSIGSCFCYFPTVYGQIINTFNERRLIEQRRSTIDAASRADESHNVARVIPHINGHGGATAAHGYTVTNLPPVTALDLNMIITEPRARTALLEHCVDELSSENLAFVFKVRAWKQAYDKEVPQKINKVGINMYKEYVSRTSKTPINIPNNICVHVDKLIEPYLASEEASGNDGVSPLTHGKIPRSIFDACENECLKIIRTDTLPRFRNSKLFKERIIETGILEKILN